MPIDTSDMRVLHAAMLRELRLAPDAVRRVSPDDARRRSVVLSHLRFVVDLVHHHHEGEDEMLWPVLRQRTDDVRDIADAIGQHEAIDHAMQASRTGLDTWSSTANADTRDALIAHLERAYALLRDHFEFEEQRLLPLAAETMSAAEWNRLGDAGAAATAKKDLPLLFGMLAYDGDPAVMAGMLAHAPKVAQLVLPRVAPHVYARRARRVYGTARP